MYGSQDTTLTNKDFISTIDLNLFSKNPDFYFWGLANYASSYSLKINYKVQNGLGLAYNFINTATAWLNMSEGILYEVSSLNTGNSNHEKYETFRNSFRLAF